MSPAASPRLPPWLAAGLLLALVALVWFSLAAIRASRPTASRMPPAFHPLLRWHDAGGDWLLVADAGADQLTVYSAADGHRVRRVKVERGLSDAATLIQRDGRLFVIDAAGGLDELKLSSRPQIAANLR